VNHPIVIPDFVPLLASLSQLLILDNGPDNLYIQVQKAVKFPNQATGDHVPDIVNSDLPVGTGQLGIKQVSKFLSTRY
jgi:hypothetical protein